MQFVEISGHILKKKEQHLHATVNEIPDLKKDQFRDIKMSF